MNSCIIQLHAQALPPLQPEQDACSALTLCKYSFFTPYSYTGMGKVKNEVNGNMTIGDAFETNAVWFRIKVATAGNIVFTITPVDSTDDYDFSVFNIGNMQCPYTVDGLTQSRIRYNGNCNANCPAYPGMLSAPGGTIGLDYMATEPYTPGGMFGKAFLQYIAAEEGEEFLVMVNNFSQSAAGFGINFSGSTALFENDGLPEYDTVVAVCNTNYATIKITLTEPVLCNSIAADGSDFILSSSAINIISATGINCTGNATTYTSEIVLTLSSRLQLGSSYTLQSKTGTDGNTLLDLCDEQQPEGISKSFTVAEPLRINAGNDTAVCVGGSIALITRLEGSVNARIRWQPATFLDDNTIANPTTKPTQDIEYVALVAPIGYPASCYHRDTIRIKVLKGFDIVTADTTLCKPEKIAIQLQGDAAFTYTWSPPDYLSGSTGMLQNTVPEKSVTYTVTASYPGCKDSVQAINIGVREWPDLVTKDTIVCQGQSVPLQVDGDGNFIHKWSPILYLSDAAISNPIATPSSNIIYTLTTSFAGCADSVQSVAITLEPLPDIGSMIFDTVCIGSILQMFPSVAPSGYGNYNYQWEPAVAFNNANTKNAIYTAINTGLVSLTVSTPQGCADTLSQLLSVSPLPVVHAGKDITIVEGQTITLQGSVNQPAEIIKWMPARYLSNNAVLNPIATLPASQNFVLSISNEYGCMAKDSVFITVLKDIHIPNAFSPNADGINDVWNIPGLASYQNSKTQVFNRWGQMVFESKGYSKPWNGAFKGQQLPVGVYYYLINLENGSSQFNGAVTLLR